MKTFPGTMASALKYGLLAVLLLMFVATAMPAPANSQSVVYLINPNDILKEFGSGNNTNIVLIGDTDQIMMQDPIIVVGSGIDSYERRGLEKTLEVNYFPAARIVNDTATTYGGKNLTDYDLILIGGPDHNAYTKFLCDLGILTYNVTDKKMPAMVMEVEPTGTDLKVLAVGDVSGYPYHRKDLPLNGIIPEQYAPAAAVVTGAGLGILVLLLEKLLSGFNAFISSSWDSVISYLSNHVSELFGEKEGQIRKVQVREEKIAGRRKYFLGLTAVEIGLAILASILFGFANLFAARTGIDAGDVLIYVLVGGVAVVAHDIGHRVVAARYHLKTEYQFWGYGTILMLLTSWLFGAVFAQPARTIIEGEDKRGLALSFFTGPLISIILAFAFLALLPLGGTLGTIGVLGFTMNLISGLYMLMPFYPMDGKKVMEWSWKYWGLIFVPLLIFYVVVMVMFV